MQEKVQYRDGLRKNATTKNRRQSTETKAGAYMVDWDNANVIDLQTGETVLNSILVEPY